MLAAGRLILPLRPIRSIDYFNVSRKRCCQLNSHSASRASSLVKNYFALLFPFSFRHLPSQTLRWVDHVCCSCLKRHWFTYAAQTRTCLLKRLRMLIAVRPHKLTPCLLEPQIAPLLKASVCLRLPVVARVYG